MTLDGTMIATHGGALALAASVVIMGSLRMNPRLFLRHFPDKVKASQPPHSRQEWAAGIAVGLVLLALFVGGPVWSTLEFARTREADFISLWVHAFLVGMIANLVDWLVLDELWLGVGKPRWALPAGVTPEDVLPFEHKRHFRGFLTGTILFAIVAGIAAAIAFFLAAPSGPRASVILGEEPAPKLSDYGFFATPNAGAGACGGRRALRSRQCVVQRSRGQASLCLCAKGTAGEIPAGERVRLSRRLGADQDVCVCPGHARSGAERAFHRDAALDPQGRGLGRLSLHLECRADRGGLCARRRAAEDRDGIAGRAEAVDQLRHPQPQPVQGMPSRRRCAAADRAEGAQPQPCRAGRGEPDRGLERARHPLRRAGCAADRSGGSMAMRFWRSGRGPGSTSTARIATTRRARASNSGLFLDWHEADPTGWGVHKRPTAAGHGARAAPLRHRAGPSRAVHHGPPAANRPSRAC